MNKGFTLVELLGVLVVLSVLTLIITVTVGSIISDSEKSLSDTQKKYLEDAAKVYYLKEGMNNSDNCVSVQELIDGGYVENEKVINPEGKTEMTGYVKITHASNQYAYKYQETSCE